MKEFKAFLLRGNVVELAVAVLIGAAFGAVVTSFTQNLLTPLLAVVGGQPSLADMVWKVNKTEFRYGEFIDSVVSFVTIAAVIFFLVIRPLDRRAKRNQAKPPPPDVRPCPECLSSIPTAAVRCAFCTAQVVVR
ncbi:MAG: large conductance mechanosensitive channel protein MscL [Acidimicrobiia bacterium]